MKRPGVTLLVALSLSVGGCGEPLDVGIAAFELGGVPQEVERLSVFVQRAEGGPVVASATIAAPERYVEFGVPAELPLRITAVARSGESAARSLGGTMPVYVARTVRTVPLGNRPFPVALDARPGGGLHLDLGGVAEGGELPLVLEGPGGSIPLAFDAPKRGSRTVQVLAQGRWSLRADDPDWTVDGGEGLWVAQGVDTVAHPRLRRVSPVELDAAQGLSVDVSADGAPLGAGPVPTSTGSTTPLDLRVLALDGRTEPTAQPLAEVEVRAWTVPPGLVAPASRQVSGLPVDVGAFRVSGAGRVHFEVKARLDDGRALTVGWHRNLRRPGGAPRRVELSVVRPEALVAGTPVRAFLLDADDRLADAPSWELDVSASDDWVYFPDGPMSRGRGPVASFSVSRPSAPRAERTTLRAVATSTVFAGTSTGALLLPDLMPSSDEGGEG